MNWYRKKLGLFCSLILFWPGLALLTSTELSVFRTVEYYLPEWTLAAIIVRITIIGIFILAVSVLLGKLKGYGKLALILLFIPIIDDIVFALGNNKFGSLFLFSDSIIEAVNQAFALLLVSLILIGYEKVGWPLGKKWIYPVLILLAFGSNFIKPVYIDDWNDPESNESQWATDEMRAFLNENQVQTESDRFVVAFFTASCPHCALCALKLAINERNIELPETIAVFRGYQEDADAFMAQYGLKDVQTVLIEREVFYEYAGPSVPSIYHYNGIENAHFTGSTFGFRALDHISVK